MKRSIQYGFLSGTRTQALGAITFLLSAFYVPSAYSIFAHPLPMGYSANLAAYEDTTRANSQSSGAILLIEDFQKETVGTLPSKWYNRDGDAIPAEYEPVIRDEYQYRVMEENGNRFLRFEGMSAKHLNFPLVDKQGVDLEKMPILQWRWRIHSLPEEASEMDEKRNDAAASVYVVFEIGRVLFKAAPRSIRYTWSSTLEEGTEFEKFFGHQNVVVLQSGKERVGEWITQRVDLVEEYARLFGRQAPSAPLAILILSDGDNTQSSVMADYDDFMFTTRTQNE